MPPESLRNAVREAYDVNQVAEGKAPLPRTDFVMGHEFLRMVVQDRAFRGLVTEAMDAEAAWTGMVLEFLHCLVDPLGQMVAGLPTDSRALVEDAVARTTDALRALQVRVESDSAPITYRGSSEGVADGEIHPRGTGR